MTVDEKRNCLYRAAFVTFFSMYTEIELTDEEINEGIERYEAWFFGDEPPTIRVFFAFVLFAFAGIFSEADTKMQEEILNESQVPEAHRAGLRAMADEVKIAGMKL